MRQRDLSSAAAQNPLDARGAGHLLVGVGEREGDVLVGRQVGLARLAGVGEGLLVERGEALGGVSMDTVTGLGFVWVAMVSVSFSGLALLQIGC
jgi:hypothetical protein